MFMLETTHCDDFYLDGLTYISQHREIFSFDSENVSFKLTNFQIHTQKVGFVRIMESAN